LHRFEVIAHCCLNFGHGFRAFFGDLGSTLYYSS